jgi:hypothetical protein
MLSRLAAVRPKKLQHAQRVQALSLRWAYFLQGPIVSAGGRPVDLSLDCFFGAMGVS